MKKDIKITEIFSAENSEKKVLPLYETSVSAGFPSPADDFIDQKLDLNKYLIKNAPATFLVRVDGESMIDAGIRPGSILIVDRSLNAEDGKIIVAILDGEFTVKRIEKRNGAIILKPENNSGNYKSITISEDREFEVWGVVTSIIQEIG